MKTILVLGSWGFLGSNLLLALEQRFRGECNIIAFDRHAEHPLHLTCPSVKKIYFGDFQDAKILAQIFSENKIDIVFHLVSSTVPASSSNARFDVETNLLPTIDLLEQMVIHRLSRIVYISSGGAVYGAAQGQHKESDEVFPVNSYGAVKIAIEKYLFMYAHQYKIMPLVVRLSNPYGLYHVNRKQGFINVALRAALSGTPVQVWGDGNNRKDYIFVEDCIDAILDLVDAQAWGEIVNVGSGQEFSLNEILGEIQNIVGSFSWQYSEIRSFDTQNFSLDISKLNQLTTPRLQTDLRTGIIKTNQWLRANSDCL